MKKLILFSLAALVFLASFKIQAEELRAIAFSVEDYERSKETGSVFSPYVTEFPQELMQMKAGPFGALDQSSIPTNYIIGGSTASRNEYPEYALVLILNAAETEFIGSCGGTLIGSNKVLTAAHCLVFSSNRYVVIPNFYSFNDLFTASDFFDASSVRRHPSYNSSSTGFDIGVITMQRSSSSRRAPVFAGGSNLAGVNGTVIGTGLVSTLPERFVDVLQEVPAPIIDNATCNSIWAGLTGSRPIGSSLMCAGFRGDGRGSCSGDSGSPLFATIEGQRTLVGTVSFGLPTCENNRANQAYARTSELVSFIRSQSSGTNFVNITSARNTESGVIFPIIEMILDDDSTTSKIAPSDFLNSSSSSITVP